jgi:hypothetical protein
MNFYRNSYQMFEGIEHCVKSNLVVPALCLIYSGIDSIAWVAYGDISVRERFTRFVEEHMYKEVPLEPSSLDLYAARCAILHTMTPDSDLSAKGQAVQINYAWGTADIDELRKSVNTLLPGDKSCVHLNDLAKSFRLGVAHFVEGDFASPECIQRMKKHYSGLSPEIVSKFNETNA